jgi:hypothetical protein
MVVLHLGRAEGFYLDRHLLNEVVSNRGDHRSRAKVNVQHLAFRTLD